MSWEGEKIGQHNINSQTEGMQRLVRQASSSAISCLVQFESRLPHTQKKPGSWEPRGHPSMRTADLQTELSDYENTEALRKASKSTPLFRLFPMHLQPGYGHLVPKHKSFLSFQSRQNPGDPNCAQYPVTVYSVFSKWHH